MLPYRQRNSFDGTGCANGVAPTAGWQMRGTFLQLKTAGPVGNSNLFLENKCSVGANLFAQTLAE
jgi:hypothetical protein